MQHRALVVGVEGEAGDPADEVPPAWPRLAYAPDRAERLRGILTERYRYTPVETTADPAATAAALSEAVRAALHSGPGFVVVHLLAHGKPSDRITNGLHVVGGDGLLTDELSTWITGVEARAGEGGPTVLLLLDLCYSGRVVWGHFERLVRPELRRVWVVAASRPEDPAYDGRLSSAVAEVLGGFADGTLPLDESLEYIPIDRFCRELARRVEELGRGGPEQRIERPLAALGADLGHLRFFRNPRHRPGGGGTHPELAALLDETADAGHFVSRALGHQQAYGTQGLTSFTGRTEELNRLCGWLDGQGPALQVVTGKPGVGKSALLGMLACAAHPALRTPTQHVWGTLRRSAPRKVPGLAVVHARRRRLAAVVASLAAQWELPLPPGSSGSSGSSPWTADRLIDALHARPTAPVLLLDALDEAEHPVDLLTALLSPLISRRRPDGSPLCRVLVATRPEPGLRLLLDTARGQDGLLDLGEVPGDRLREELADFVADLLGRAEPYDAHERGLVDRLARTVADTLVSAEPEWGEFLVAGLYTRYLLEQRPPLRTPADAEALGRAVPRTLDAILDLDLGHQPDQRLRSVLTAIARAEGTGMPERLVGVVAGTDATDALLDTARFYLRRSPDGDGTPLYRIFHQGLADRLRARPELDARTLWERLLADVRPVPDRPAQWATAEHYLLRHAARHAAEAGALAELLDDPEFLVHADPAALSAELYHSGEQHPHGVVYRASLGAHSAAAPDERRQILALDAARYQLGELSAALSADGPWTVTWTAGRPLATRLLTTLIGHRGKIWDLTTLEINGRAHALTAGQDGTARLWDLRTATTVLQLPDHGAAVGCVAAAELPGGPIAVTGDDNGRLHGWDLTSGRPLWTAEAHNGPVWAVVTLSVDGVPRVVSAGEDERLRHWDAETGHALATVALPRYGGTVRRLARYRGTGVLVHQENGGVTAWDADGTRIAVRHVDGREDPVTAATALDEDGPDVATAHESGAVSLFGRTVRPRSRESGHAGEITVLSATRRHGGAPNRHLLTGSNDGTVRMAHVDHVFVYGATKERWRMVATHTTAITAVTDATVDGRWCLLTAGEGGTVRIWNPDGEFALRQRRGHRHAVTALAVLPDGRLVSASREGEIGVIDAQRADDRDRFFVLTGAWPNSIAVSPGSDGTLVLVAGQAHGVLGVDPDGRNLWVSPAQPRSNTVIAALSLGGGSRHAVTGDEDGHVWLHRHDRPGITRLMRASAEVTSLTTVGGTVLVGDRRGVVWKVTPGRRTRPERVFQNAAWDVHALAVCTVDNRPHVLSGHEDGSVHLTDLDGTHRRELLGHTEAVFAVAPAVLDGRPCALTGGFDRTLRLWDLTTGTQLHRLWFPDSIFAVAVGPDGGVFVGMGPDVIRLDLDPNGPVLRPTPPTPGGTP
ncbi:AAA family ATPase [Kitasatospora sp. NPDC101447]|uniref:AAA family ATPase n=1 Tax=Kitasatospora sp. NPDC101447 TaxID=3364102 RepID=UPI00382437CD